MDYQYNSILSRNNTNGITTEPRSKVHNDSVLS